MVKNKPFLRFIRNRLQSLGKSPEVTLFFAKSITSTNPLKCKASIDDRGQLQVSTTDAEIADLRKQINYENMKSKLRYG